MSVEKDEVVDRKLETLINAVRAARYAAHAADSALFEYLRAAHSEEGPEKKTRATPTFMAAARKMVHPTGDANESQQDDNGDGQEREGGSGASD